MFSNWLVRFTGIATLSLAVCGAASAQYGGGGTPGTGGTGASGGGYTPAAGAAVGIALLVRHHHHSAEKTQETYVTGCTQSVQDGMNLTDEKDNQTYSIMSNSKSLKAGERITLKGVLVTTASPGNPTFRMRSVIKDYGICGAASAYSSSAANPTSLN